MTEENPEVSEACLKGRNAAFMATAKRVGLHAETYAMWNTDTGKHSWPCGDPEIPGYDKDSTELWKQVQAKGFILTKKWYSDYPYAQVGDYGSCEWALESSKVLETAQLENVKWVNDRDTELARKCLTVASYGNQPSHDAFYHTAAILVKMPAASERQIPADIMSRIAKQKDLWSWRCPNLICCLPAARFVKNWTLEIVVQSWTSLLNRWFCLTKSKVCKSVVIGNCVVCAPNATHLGNLSM